MNNIKFGGQFAIAVTVALIGLAGTFLAKPSVVFVNPPDTTNTSGTAKPDKDSTDLYTSPIVAQDSLPEAAAVTPASTENIAVPERTIEPIKKKEFTVLFSPVTRDTRDRYYNLQATITNTTSSPIYLAINKRAIPVLIDDRGIDSRCVRVTGMERLSDVHKSKYYDEKSYAMIDAKQSHAIALRFPITKPASKAGSSVNITSSFLLFQDGRVDKRDLSGVSYIR